MPKLKWDEYDKSVSIEHEQYDVKNEGGMLYTWFNNMWSNPLDLNDLAGYVSTARMEDANVVAAEARELKDRQELEDKYPELLDTRQCLEQMQALYKTAVDSCKEKETIVDILSKETANVGARFS